jgi:hypothetical protein
MVAAALGALGMGPNAAADEAEHMPARDDAGAVDAFDGAVDAFDGAGWDADSYAVAVRQMDGAAALVWRSLLVWLGVLATAALLF